MTVQIVPNEAPTADLNQISGQVKAGYIRRFNENLAKANVSDKLLFNLTNASVTTNSEPGKDKL